MVALKQVRVSAERSPPKCAASLSGSATTMMMTAAVPLAAPWLSGLVIDLISSN
jgi:hypothetical protein